MKAVILAGGLGTRLSEETHLKPKPMVEVGGMPILWHIMKIYSAYGINDFIICLGYKGYVIKEFFSNYFLHSTDVTFDLTNNQMEVHSQPTDNWKVTLVDTGAHSNTGGRLRNVRQYLNDETFCFTYGDGVCDINIHKEIEFHRSHGKLATLTAVQPPGRYGNLSIHAGSVDSFKEKPSGDGGWINGGFFVLEPKVFDYISGDATSWESDVLEQLAAKKELRAYQHPGFWQAMDTLRDKNQLEALWNSENVPWKVWDALEELNPKIVANY